MIKKNKKLVMLILFLCLTGCSKKRGKLYTGTDHYQVRNAGC